jgi:glycosyltransferase involved in cell wall biosynthesis
MKVTVAIPHYNSLGTLWSLLSQLKEDTFDQIVVLDDFSDKKPNKLEAEFPSIAFYYGKENVGAGANRNRVMKLVDEGIVWFVDADMEIVSQNNADRLKKLFTHEPHQLIGGLIYTKLGQQMGWNYGHEMHPVHDARFQELVTSLSNGDLSVWPRLKHYGWNYPWLQPGLREVTKHSVDWVAEGSFAVPIELFRTLGGYDTAFRFHEGQDLAKRVRASGANIQIVPDLITRHLEVDVRGKQRAEEFRDAQYLFFNKHWGMSRDVYDKLYKQ